MPKNSPCPGPARPLVRKRHPLILLGKNTFEKDCRPGPASSRAILCGGLPEQLLELAGRTPCGTGTRRLGIGASSPYPLLDKGATAARRPVRSRQGQCPGAISPGSPSSFRRSTAADVCTSIGSTDGVVLVEQIVVESTQGEITATRRPWLPRWHCSNPPPGWQHKDIRSPQQLGQLVVLHLLPKAMLSLGH